MISSRINGGATLDKTIVRLVGIQVVTGIGFVIGLWLAGRGFPYIASLFGALAFLLPAFNLALATEQMTEKQEKFFTLFLWTSIFSLTFTPAATYIFGRFLTNTNPVITPLPAFGMWWAFTIVGLLAATLVKRIPTGISRTKIDLPALRETLVLVAVFVGIMVVNFILYPFLPEGDGYALLITFIKGQQNYALLAAEPRILFFQLLNLWANLLQVDPYWILKAVLPVSYIVVVLTLYEVARPILTSTVLRIIAAVSPLFFPVFLQEALISRPQTIAVLTLVPALYLLGNIVAEKKGVIQLYWIGALVAVGLIGLKFHTLVFTLTILSFAAAIMTLWPVVKKRPWDSLVIAGLLAVLAYPWAASQRIIADLWHILSLFWHAIRHVPMDLWFIDFYRNADGQELGWPGWSAALYYGYNIGFFLPVALLFGVLVKKLALFRQFWHQSYWAVLGVLFFFFFIAELAPRFGFAYMPDRAWLFIAVAMVFLLPRIMATVVAKYNKWAAPMFVASAILSLAAGMSVTYAKKGWMMPHEYNAGQFIRTKTPANAVFLGGGGIMATVRYYGQRTLIRPSDEVFLADDEEAVAEYLERVLSPDALVDHRTMRRADIAAQLTKVGQAYQGDENGRQRENILAQLRTLIGTIETEYVDLDAADNQSLKPDSPVYLIYSRNRFDNLYGQRAWWRVSNFYGANLEKFSKRYPVVYDQDGVTIWEVKK